MQIKYRDNRNSYASSINKLIGFVQRVNYSPGTVNILGLEMSVDKCGACR